MQTFRLSCLNAWRTASRTSTACAGSTQNDRLHVACLKRNDCLPGAQWMILCERTVDLPKADVSEGMVELMNSLDFFIANSRGHFLPETESSP